MNVFVLRKESTTIDKTVYSDFVRIGRQANSNGRRLFDFVKFRVDNPNGQFLFSGLDDPEKVKGLSDFDHVFLNELSKFDESDLAEVKRRLRGRKGQKIWCDWNPISEEHWIKTGLIDCETWFDAPKEIAGISDSRLDDSSFVKLNERKDIVLIKTTYRDNMWIVGPRFIDRHALQEFENMRTNKPNEYQVYGLGEYGSYRTGGEFWKKFDIDRHVKPVEYTPDAPLHITVDINRYPYITQTLWQIIAGGERTKVRQIGEALAYDPENTAKGAINMLVRHPIFQHNKNVILLYGDASGKTKSATDGQSFFGAYIRELQKHIPVIDRIIKVNPSVATSGAWINELYAGAGSLDIEISDTCTVSKNDYNSVKEAPDGTMVKEKIKDDAKGISYEKNGHISDAKRYFLCQAFASEFKQYRERQGKYQIFGV